MIRASLAFIFAVSFSCVTLPAAGQFNFNLGGEVTRPASGLADLVEEDYGYGAHAALTYWLSYRVQLVCSGGYITYGGEKITSRTEVEDLVNQGLDAIVDRIEGNYSSIPVTAGLRYYPLERLFVQGAAGVVYKRTRQMGNGNANTKEGFVTERDLVVSPGIGLLLGRFSLQAQYSVSRDEWRWMSLGVSMIFGKL